MARHSLAWFIAGFLVAVTSIGYGILGSDMKKREEIPFDLVSDIYTKNEPSLSIHPAQCINPPICDLPLQRFSTESQVPQPEVPENQREQENFVKASPLTLPLNNNLEGMIGDQCVQLGETERGFYCQVGNNVPLEDSIKPKTVKLFEINGLTKLLVYDGDKAAIYDPIKRKKESSSEKRKDSLIYCDVLSMDGKPYLVFVTNEEVPQENMQEHTIPIMHFYSLTVDKHGSLEKRPFGDIPLEKQSGTNISRVSIISGNYGGSFEISVSSATSGIQGEKLQSTPYTVELQKQNLGSNNLILILN